MLFNGVKRALAEENSTPSPAHRLTSGASICSVAIYGGAIDLPKRIQERQRRNSDPGFARRPPPPRLPDRQAHRAALPGRARISRRFALSHAAPPRAAPLGRRALDREAGAAPPPLLPAHRRGPENACRAAPQLARIHSRHGARGPGGPCLIGSNTSGSIYLRWAWQVRARRRSEKSWRSSSKMLTRKRLPGVLP